MYEYVMQYMFAVDVVCKICKKNNCKYFHKIRVTVDCNVDSLKKEALKPLTICSDQKIEIMLIDFGTVVIIEKKSVRLYCG